mgnify:CR=1
MMGIGTPINHNKMERIFTLLYCLLLPCARAHCFLRHDGEGNSAHNKYLA